MTSMFTVLVWAKAANVGHKLTRAPHFDAPLHADQTSKAAKRKQSEGGTGAQRGLKSKGRGDRPSVSGSPPSWLSLSAARGLDETWRGFICQFS